MTAPIPEEATVAAAEAMQAREHIFGENPWMENAKVALAAAAPFIRAGERARIREMAAELEATVPQAKVNGVVLSTVPFADLLGERSDG